MANEISISVSLAATKNSATMSLSGTATQDMTGSDMTQVTQELTATPEILLLVDVATPAAYIYIRNLETAATDIYVSLDSGGTQKISTIKPGKFILLSPSVAQNTYLAASVGPARAQVGAVEA